MRSFFTRLHRRFGRRMNIDERAQLIDAKLKLAPAVPSVEPTVMALAMSGRPRPKVAIVGGGFAGLMAGYVLRGDCEVTVFEARSRVGGRVWSKTKSSGLIEAGGELIGYNHPLWLKLARKFELGFSVNTSDGNYDSLDLDVPLYLGGKKLSDDDAEKIYKDMDNAFAEMSEQAVKIEKVDPNRPWLAKHASRLDQMPLSKWIAGRRYRHPLSKAAMEQQFSNDAGVPTSEQSYLANLAAVAGGVLGRRIDAFFTQSEALRCSGGNDSLARRLAAEIKAMRGEVRVCSPVRAIRIDEEGVTLDYGSGHPSGEDCIYSDVDAPQSFAADYVILAIPPSLWPAASHPQIRITPELPRDYYISMGKAVKYLSPLKQRFWIGNGLAPSATSDRIGVTWEGTDNQIAPPERGVELSLFAGGHAAVTALGEWERGGKPAVDRFYQAKIDAIYPGYAANLSGEPDFMAWPEDPWTRAGYSFPAPGEVTLAGPLLHRPFRKRMFFAGEHTCFAYIGYMEGALQSGHRAGSAIRRAVKAKVRGGVTQAPAAQR